MDKENLVYNEEHMTAIAQKYNEAAKIIHLLTHQLIYSYGPKVVLTNTYEGEGKELALELFDKLKQHLDFLKSCCINTGEYIIESLETMKELDKSIMKKNS